MVRAILTNFSMIAQSLVLETGTSNSLGSATNNQRRTTNPSVPNGRFRKLVAPINPLLLPLQEQTGNGTVSSDCNGGETGIGWTCEPGKRRSSSPPPHCLQTMANRFLLHRSTPPIPPSTALPLRSLPIARICRRNSRRVRLQIPRCICASSIPSSAVFQRHLHPSHEGTTGYLPRPNFGSGFALPPERIEFTNDYESVMPRLVSSLETHRGLVLLTPAEWDARFSEWG